MLLNGQGRASASKSAVAAAPSRRYNRTLGDRPSCFCVQRRLRRVLLLTGGLLVRVQPEEPLSRTKSTTFARAAPGVRARCPFLALSVPCPSGRGSGGGAGASNKRTSADRYA